MPKKHRGGRERSEKKRKKFQQVRWTIQEEEDLIAMQMAELNETQEVRDQIGAVLRNAYLAKYRSEPGPSGSKGPDQSASESEGADYEEEISFYWCIQLHVSLAMLVRECGPSLLLSNLWKMQWKYYVTSWETNHRRL